MKYTTDAALAAARQRNNPNGEQVGHFTGRCARCHSTDLWDDNLAYGCNDCGAFLNSNDIPAPGLPIIPDGAMGTPLKYTTPQELADACRRNNPDGEPVGTVTGRCPRCHSTECHLVGCNDCGAFFLDDDFGEARQQRPFKRLVTADIENVELPEGYTIMHITPAAVQCRHEWPTKAGGEVDKFGRCPKCGMSFLRYVYTQCP